MNSIFKGIQAYVISFKLISGLGLWKYFAIPILISILTAALIGVVAWSWSDNLGSFITNIWMWDWGKETFQTIAEILGGILIIVIGLILFKYIILALSAPFMSAVSTKIEQHLIGNKHMYNETSNTAQLARGIKISLRNLGMEVLITIPLLLLSLIPLINLIATVLLFVVQAYYAGFGNMDYTIERHYTFKESIAFVRQNRGTAIGNGIVFIALLFIPIIGVVLVLPLSVTASTVETVKLLQKEAAKKIET